MPTLTQRVIDICDRILPSLGPEGIGRQVGDIRRGLEQPLRVAVAGRVKAGKSTLVNALLGQRIAPTATGECTKVLTWFGFDHRERVEIRSKQAGTREIPLTKAGRIPDDLGAEVHGIEAVHVFLPHHGLEAMTLIDTPGLSSLNEQTSDRTEELLGMHDASQRGLAEADALVFVIRQGAMEDDAKALAAFQAAVGGVRASAVNAVGVLTRADQLDPSGDPWAKANEIAEHQSSALRRLVATVIPTMGLLAETAESGVFEERDARALRALAEHSADERRRMLGLGAAGFRRFESPNVDLAERERLIDMLDVYGIRFCLEQIDAGRKSAGQLAEAMRARSGIGDLRRLIRSTFEERTDVLKADRALQDLEALSWTSPTREDSAALISLRNDIEHVRLDPEMHQLAEMAAMWKCANGEAGLPEVLEDEVRRIALSSRLWERLGLDKGATPGDLTIAAREGAGRWASLASGGPVSPQGAAVARTMRRSYELTWAELSAQEAVL